MMSVPVKSDDGEEFGELQLRIIEWRQGKHRALYYGSDDQHFIHEESGSEVEPLFTYSAYIIWPQLVNQAEYIGWGEMSPEPFSSVWKAARGAIRAHFATRRRKRRREQNGWTTGDRDGPATVGFLSG